MARTKSIKNSLIPLNPSFFSHLISASPFFPLLFSPKKSSPRSRNYHLCSLPTFLLYFLSLLIIFTFLGISILTIIPTTTKFPCSAISPSSPRTSLSFPFPFSFHSLSSSNSPLLLASISALISDTSTGDDDEPIRLSKSVMVPLPPHGLPRNLSEKEREFWQQPEGEGYWPCLDFSIKYRRASAKISQEKKRFLIVVVSGGLNQQRNQIVDAVVIARILEAALVVPVLQVNPIWEDER